MGTEIIYADSHDSDIPDDTKPTGRRVFYDSRMEIRSNEDYVEIGMVYPTEDGDYGDPGIEPDGAKRVFGSFNRHALNRMIRDLRKARDRAYGRDE
jgi:hypothetical protein